MPETPEGDFTQYVLDGQQRITSIYASLKGLTIKKTLNGIEREEDFSKMYIDLEAKEDEQIVVIDTEIENKDLENFIKLRDLLFGGLTQLTKYPERHLSKLEKYKQRIESYNFSSILTREIPIDIATEIFTRINVGGKPLSTFEIMVAKTFDAESGFDLAENYNKLINELRGANYETIPDATVLQTVSVIIKKECKKKIILNLDKKKFIKAWGDAVSSIKDAVDYFKYVYKIPVSQLLPYNALIVPFAYFFHNHKDRPTGDKQEYLQDFFWRSSLSERYSSSVETKLAQDIKRIDKILKDELPKYDYDVDISEDYIKKNGWFSTGRSFIKSILCIYASKKPKSFIDEADVCISNDWLKIAISRNYHHFFPRAYLRKKGVDESYINHILNITIVDDFLNKREIRDKAPSKYMKEFKKKNPHLENTMKTHLITGLDRFGIWDDDYGTFCNMRARILSRELKKKLVKQDKK